MPAAPPSLGMSVHDFHQLAEVPPALTWFANIQNPLTGRAYQNDVQEFMALTKLENPAHFYDVSRAHVLIWRRHVERRALSSASIRRKLAALSCLFEALYKPNALQGNPVDGVKRPKIASSEGKTPVIGDH